MRVAERLSDDDVYYVVAMASRVGGDAPRTGEGSIIGFGEASVTARAPVFEATRILHLHCVFVDEAWRRRGVGRALLDDMLHWGRDKRCVEADLNVLESNPAVSLYRSCGFTDFRRTMRLSLTDDPTRS